LKHEEKRNIFDSLAEFFNRSASCLIKSAVDENKKVRTN